MRGDVASNAARDGARAIVSARARETGAGTTGGRHTRVIVGRAVDFGLPSRGALTSRGRVRAMRAIGETLDDPDASTSSAVDGLDRDVLERLVPTLLPRRARRDEAVEAPERVKKRAMRKMNRASAKKRKKVKKDRNMRARVLTAAFSKDEVPKEKEKRLKSETDKEKRIVDPSDDMEVIIHGLETYKAFKTHHKKTYVQVTWKGRRQTRRKVKTFRRENTDNPQWGSGEKFTFPNCSPHGKFVIKVKEARSLGMKVVVGRATIPSVVIPRDGTKVRLRIALLTRRKKAKVELVATLGKSNQTEPTLGDNGHWGNAWTNGGNGTNEDGDGTARSARDGLDAIIVNVVSARDIFASDASGTSDAYVKCGFDTAPIERRYKTQVVKRTRYPMWNDRFLMRIEPGGDEHAIVFTVWDKDVFSGDDFIGAAAIPLEVIPRNGDVCDVELPLNRKVDPNVSGEFCWMHPRATSDCGVIRVQAHAVVGEEAAKVLEVVKLGKIGRADGTKLARSVHVAVVAARQLFHVDAGGGTCDAFTYIRMDNAPKNEFCRTETILNTLHPVWKEGIGQVFTLISRPGCSSIIFDLYDRNTFSSKVLMGRAQVSLIDLPADGSWATITTPLYGMDANRNTLVGGDDSSSPWNSPDRVKGDLIVRVSATRAPHENISEPPIISENDRYVNQHDTTKHLYVQALECKKLPIRHLKLSTNAQIRMALNTHRQMIYGEVQQNVTSDFVFDTQVSCIPKTSLSTTLTVQMVGEMKPIYGSATCTKFTRKTLHWFGWSRGHGGASEQYVAIDDDESDDEGDAAEFEDGDHKFSSGNAIGYAQISVKDLKPGDIVKHKLKLCPLVKTKSWLRALEDDLGEIEVLVGCGYAKDAPKDLRKVDHVARRAIGKFSMNIVSVVGDKTPYQRVAPLIDNVLGSVHPSSNEMFGKHVYATIMWDGREEHIKSSQERFNFAVTEIAGDIRVLIRCPDKLSMSDQILGVVSIPVTEIVASKEKFIDAWFNITPPNSMYLTAEDMADASRQVCVYPRSTKRPTDWQGYVRLKISFEPSTSNSEWQWYLQQAPLMGRTPHIPDTIDGVLQSLQRVVESILMPFKTITRAAIFMSVCPKESRTPKMLWITYHTVCCVAFEGEILSTFMLLWIIPGLMFCGYCSRFVVDDLERIASPFESKLDDAEEIRRQVHDMAKKRNRKMRKFRDEILERIKLEKLQNKGRAVRITREVVDMGVQRRRAKRARMGVDDELPTITSMFMPQHFINHIVAVLTSANPAEIVLRLIQKIVWNLLKVLKSAGSTIVRIDQVISSGGPKLMPGVCTLVGANLETAADNLDRPIRLLTYDDPKLTKYFSLLLVAFTFAMCCVLLALKKCIRFIDSYSVLRLWHALWLIGIAPVLPFSSGPLLRASTSVEYVIQLIVGLYVPVQPLSLQTIAAVRDSLENELKDDYKRLRELVQRQMNIEIERRTKLSNKKTDDLQKRFSNNSRINPLGWLAFAHSRAPTSLTRTHAHRTRAFMVPGDQNPPNVSVFRKDVDVGRATLHLFSELIMFAIDVPIRALSVPYRVASIASAASLNVYDGWVRFTAFNWVRSKERKRDVGVGKRELLPFGSRKVSVQPTARATSGVVDVVDDDIGERSVRA